MKCFQVWFRFKDEDVSVWRKVFIDAENKDDASDIVALRYEDCHIIAIDDDCSSRVGEQFK